MYILNPIDINANTNLTQEFNFDSQEHSRDKHREIFTGINVDRHGGCEKETVGVGGNTKSNSGPPSATKTLHRSKKWMRTGTRRRLLIAGENPLRRKIQQLVRRPHSDTQTISRTEALRQRQNESLILEEFESCRRNYPLSP